MSATTKQVTLATNTEQELRALLALMAQIQPKPTEDALSIMNDFLEKVSLASEACVKKLCAEKGFREFLELFKQALSKQGAISTKTLGASSKILLKIYNKTGQKIKAGPKNPKSPVANSANANANANAAAAAATATPAVVSSPTEPGITLLSDIISIVMGKFKSAPKLDPKTAVVDKSAPMDAEERVLQILNSKIEQRPFLTLPEDIFSYDMELCLTFFKQDEKLNELLRKDKFISLWNRYNGVLDEVLKASSRWANVPMAVHLYEKQQKLFEVVNVFFNKVSPLIKGSDDAYPSKENLFKLKTRLVVAIQQAHSKQDVPIKRAVGLGQKVSNFVSQLVLIDTNIFNEENVMLANVGRQVGMSVHKELLDAIAQYRKFNQLLTAVGIVECGGVKYERGADLYGLNAKLLTKLSAIDSTVSTSLQQKDLNKGPKTDIFATILKSVSPASGGGDALAQMRLTRLLLSTASENQSAMVSYVGEKDLFDLVQSVDEGVLSWNNKKDKNWAKSKKKELAETFTVGDLGLGDMLYLFNALLYDVPLITANNAMIEQIDRHPVTKYLFSCVNIVVPRGLDKTQIAYFVKNPDKLKDFVLIARDEVVSKVAQHYTPSIKSRERQRVRKALLNDLWNSLVGAKTIQQSKIKPSTDVSMALLEMIKHKYQPESLFAMSRHAENASAATTAAAGPAKPSAVLASAASALPALGNVSLMGVGSANVNGAAAASAAGATAGQSTAGSTGAMTNDPEAALEALQQTVAVISNVRVAQSAAANTPTTVANSFSAVVNRALQIQVKLPSETGLVPGRQLRWLNEGRGDLSPFVIAGAEPQVPKKLSLVRAQSS